MELAAPGGNCEKLAYAYAYGADAVYIGLKQFSLRVKADNFSCDEAPKVEAVKRAFPGKKLYCALNVSFHNHDLDQFIAQIENYRRFPFDAFIIQDLGLIDLLQKHFPHTSLHVSTQANCINREAAKQYLRLGFSRIILGRETTLAEIRNIKDAVPKMELEAFAHGAMCIAYSGRCLISAYLAGRSANSGHCSHSCRWDYRLLAELPQSGSLYLEEKQRPGDFLPVFEGENFTAILSSRDLCMIRHLAEMQNAGVDCLKIEGRMKSIYYTAVVTRGYRKALDALAGKISEAKAEPFIQDVYHAGHRKFSTGFYYGDPSPALFDDPGPQPAHPPNEAEAGYVLAGAIGVPLTPEEAEQLFAANPGIRLDGWRFYHYTAMNKLKEGTTLEVAAPEIASLPLLPDSYCFVRPETGEILPWVSHGHACVLYTSAVLPPVPPCTPGLLVRQKLEEP